MKFFNTFLLIGFCLVTTSAFAQMGDNAGETQQDLPKHISNVPSPVLSPQEALDSFVISDGFKVQLVACEPMIEDPVAATFAPDGSLWVIEMQSFMPDVDGNREDEPISRVVHLRDLDGDGTMDESTVFLEKLVLPRAIAPSHDGILLIAPPFLLYCKDIDGDDVCDEIQTLASGFGGLDSIEHAGNGMIFGLDNLFHNSQHPYSFKFDGETVTAIPVPPHGQWGTAQDDYGRQYYSPNSYPVLVDELPKQYARQRGEQRKVDGLYRGIVTDKRVWPAHPTPGVNRGYQEGILDSSFRIKSFDAACGPAVYRDSLFGNEFEGNVFMCESAGNLVSRFIIKDDEKGSLQAVPAYSEKEFLASTDERFRPVNAINGPDGALYIVDMYRGIIQHRMFVTSFLRKQIKIRNLETPLGLGRIWRVIPEDREPREIPNLTSMNASTLASHITHANGTVRDMAQRLLTQSPDNAATSTLKLIADTAEKDRDRIKALWTLRGMGLLEKELALTSLRDTHPMVRANAIRLCEPWLDEQNVFHKITALRDDPNELVRRQLALSIGTSKKQTAILFLLEELGKYEDDRYRSSAMAGLMGLEKDAISLIGKEKSLFADTPLNRKTLAQITQQLLSQKNEKTNSQLVRFMTEPITKRPWQSEVVMTKILQYLEQENSRQLRLHAPPLRWNRFQENPPKDIIEKVVRLDSQLWWPSRQDVREFMPEHIDDTIANLIIRGRKVYNICKTCHQDDGMGMPPTYPPLAKSDYVIGDPTRLIKILLHGVTGPMTIDGVTYTDHMPPAPVKNDYDIAAVITYVRQEWGNSEKAVYPLDVKHVRAEFSNRKSMWTEQELLND